LRCHRATDIRFKYRAATISRRKDNLPHTGIALSIPTIALRIELFVLRHEAKVSRMQQANLQRRNERSKRPLLSPDGPVVSMTTHGERLKTVHLALESIAAGSVLPSRLILWLDTKEGYEQRTSGLNRLVDRGLEIYLCDNFGPHTKYFPYVLSADSLDTPLVTGDDDLLYSRWWLEGMVRAHDSNPLDLNCYRAHVVTLSNRVVTPYRGWDRCVTSRASYLHFPTGVSGCIYPRRLQETLKCAGTAFLDACPKADDVWIHVNALRAGIKVRQIRNRPLRFPFIPGTQENGLYHNNVLDDGNDFQIRRTYSESDVLLLEACKIDGN